MPFSPHISQVSYENIQKQERYSEMFSVTMMYTGADVYICNLRHFSTFPVRVILAIACPKSLQIPMKESLSFLRRFYRF